MKIEFLAAKLLLFCTVIFLILSKPVAAAVNQDHIIVLNQTYFLPANTKISFELLNSECVANEAKPNFTIPTQDYTRFDIAFSLKDQGQCLVKPAFIRWKIIAKDENNKIIDTQEVQIKGTEISGYKTICHNGNLNCKGGVNKAGEPVLVLSKNSSLS